MSNYLRELNLSKKNNAIEKVLAQAKDLNTPIVSEESINLILQLINISSSKKVLELGTAIGYSAIMMATFTNADIVTIERDEENFKRAVQNVHDAGLNDRIKIILDDALNVEIETEMFDLIFIDAAKASYIKFFDKFKNNLKSGGVIITDNLLFHGLVSNPTEAISRNIKQLVNKIDKFNKYLINNEEFDSYIYEIGDGLSISVKR